MFEMMITVTNQKEPDISVNHLIIQALVLPLTVTIKEQSTLFRLSSSATYVTRVFPIGKAYGGCTLFLERTWGRNPELSTARGLCQLTTAVSSSGSAGTVMAAGHSITGGAASDKTQHRSSPLSCWSRQLLFFICFISWIIHCYWEYNDCSNSKIANFWS